VAYAVFAFHRVSMAAHLDPRRPLEHDRGSAGIALWENAIDG